MFTLIIIVVLAVLFFFYISIPLIFPAQADSLPDYTDPIITELEEEREALFRAIQELADRTDLPAKRQESLKARYEAKAAQVLRALDEKQGENQTTLTGRKIKASSGQGRSFPYAALSLLTIVLISAVVLSNYILPRVGRDSTATTAFEEQLEAGRKLKALQKAVKAESSAQNLLALAEAHWKIGFNFEDNEQIQEAIKIYQRLDNEYDELPAIAYFRLGLSQFQNDSKKALENFAKARELKTENPEVLLPLAEIYFSIGNLTEAIELWQTYLATPVGDKDETTKERLEIVKDLTVKYEAVKKDPNEANLIALANSFWELENREIALNFYLQVVKNNPNHILALSRAGQAMFTSGSIEESVVLLDRARALEKQQSKQNLKTLLFLGNAYFSLQSYERAIKVWQEYVELAGGESSAGRIPSLITQAKARLVGETVNENFDNLGEKLYQANCSACHGDQGQGSSGPRLKGNQNLTTDKVIRIVRDGKGSMPAFEVLLDDEEIEAIASYIAN